MDPLSAIRDRFRDYVGDERPKPAPATSAAPRSVDELPSAPTSDGAKFVLTRMKYEANTPPKKLAPEPRLMLDGKSVPAPGTTNPSVETASSSAAKLYTPSPNERLARTTPWDAATLVPKLRAAWPGLTEDGARTLAAQATQETGKGGAHCYGFNFGNVKASANEPHHYLRGVWEVTSESKAETLVAGANGLARIAPDDECKKNGWGKMDGQAVVVFSPPHKEARFRDFCSVDEGVTSYVAHVQNKVMNKHPELLATLNAGDAGRAAHILKASGYFSGRESDYVSGMTKHKAAIDAQLGPVTP